MAIVADFCLTWLPAPLLCLTARPMASAGAAAAFWAGVPGASLLTAGCCITPSHPLPANAFQVVAAGALPFTHLQRLAAVARNGSKLFLVGTAASFLGTGATNASIFLRKRLDPSYAQQGEDMDLVRQSLAYGLYMSVSSNLRYQFVAGVAEQRLIEPLLHKLPMASTLASFIVRTGNTFVGSLLWVDFIRLCGLQKQKKVAPPPEPAAGKKGGARKMKK